MKRILTMAVVCSMLLVATAQADLVHHWDFTQNDGGFPLQDKAGSTWLFKQQGEGVAAPTFGDGMASFAGFDGTANKSYLRANGVNIWNANRYAVSFWFRADAAQNAFAGIVSSNDVKDGNKWQFDWNDMDSDGVVDDLRFSTETGSVNSTVGTDLLDGQWHHIAMFSIDWANRTHIYLDGVATVLNATWPGGIANFTLGSNRDQNKGFAGDIANVKIYKGDDGGVGPLAAALYAEGPQLPLPAAWNPSPDDKDVDIDPTVTLGWNTGLTDGAVDPNITAHYLYIVHGDPNFAGVTPYTIDADTDPVDGVPDATASYSVVLPYYDSVFYWRVDESISGSAPGDPCTVTGPVWQLTTVSLAPAIEAGPFDDTADFGEPIGGTDYGWFGVTMSVAAGVADEIVWYRSTDDSAWTDDGSDDANTDVQVSSSGVVTNPLEIGNAGVIDDAYYYCIASNGSGSVRSAPARLIVKRLVAYWDFESDLEGIGDGEVWSGAVVDPNEFDAISPNIGSVAGGISGNALSLDGYAYVEIADSADGFNFYPDGLTMTVWVKTVQGYSLANQWVAPVGKIALNGSDPDQGYAMWTLAADVNHQTGPSLHNTSGRAAIDVHDGQWHMMTMTYWPHSNLMIYSLDGEKQSETTVSDPATTIASLIFGRASVETDREYAGLIDEIKIYNYALNNYQIAAEYYSYTGISTCLNAYGDAFDTTGPEGKPDCRVDLYDFADFAAAWLDCGLYPNCD